MSFGGRGRRGEVPQEGIHGDIPDSNYQSIQHLISDARWNEAEVMGQIATEVNGLLGGHRHSALILD